MSTVLAWPNDIATNSDQPACIPPGIYALEYTRRYAGIIHGAPKVALWFHVVTLGEYFHTPLARYYHVKAIGNKGSFKAGWHSDLRGGLVLLDSELGKISDSHRQTGIRLLSSAHRIGSRPHQG
jgi:hypothetical protein